MWLVRRWEERLIQLAQDGESFGHYHVYVGQEAIGIPVLAALRADDLVFTTHRNHGHLLGRGADPGRLLAEVLGRATGLNGGKGGTLHACAPELGVPHTSAIVGWDGSHRGGSRARSPAARERPGDDGLLRRRSDGGGRGVRDAESRCALEAPGDLPVREQHDRGAGRGGRRVSRFDHRGDRPRRDRQLGRCPGGRGRRHRLGRRVRGGAGRGRAGASGRGTDLRRRRRRPLARQQPVVAGAARRRDRAAFHMDARLRAGGAHPLVPRAGRLAPLRARAARCRRRRPRGPRVDRCRGARDRGRKRALRARESAPGAGGRVHRRLRDVGERLRPPTPRCRTPAAAS